MASLRKRIDQHCKQCTYGKNAVGSWKQQVTVCSVTSCSLFPVRPKTKSTIPLRVLEYYKISDIEMHEGNACVKNNSLKSAESAIL